MSKRCPGEPPRGTIPPAQPHIPQLDGMKRKTKEGRSMRACKILAKELAIRRPRIKLSAGPPARTPTRPAPVSHQTRVSHSIMALPPPLPPPSPPLEIADIPLPPPRTTTKLPSPAPASSDAPSLPPSNSNPSDKPDDLWTPERLIQALQNGERSPELTEALQKLRPPHRPTGRLRYQIRASDGTSIKVLLPPRP
ncbi:hypothetical protein JTB14_019890 [Gonioctena quinquepunctata]|nr:hypothetical protein JTB14_036352 [Gonioctena quinquepunctata]KAG5861579.1 hypothetical protein JTB14_037086 [Gonioctena quinquepunctata]KAG5888119.1 hypothetical protein JTB14_019890 [Gonioctena quinquepunctata]